ncbi:MAG: hypothetical protein ACRD2C_02365 [Acidimicrobiales bacterium]
MLVVHGFWAADGLCLWAEDSERRVKSPSQALRSARSHPFAAPAGILAAVHGGKPGEAVVLLPSLRSAPLDSPELVRVVPRPPVRSAPALLPWTVPVVTFDAAGALTVLAERVEDVRYGASLDHLGELALFARELVDRGRVLPGLEPTGGGAAARWRPMVRGQDVLTTRGLVASMPPVSRSVPGRDDPRALVGAGLDDLVDAVVRERLATRGHLTPPRRGRRPQRLPVAEAWLAALTGPESRLMLTRTT